MPFGVNAVTQRECPSFAAPDNVLSLPNYFDDPNVTWVDTETERTFYNAYTSLYAQNPENTSQYNAIKTKQTYTIFADNQAVSARLRYWQNQGARWIDPLPVTNPEYVTQKVIVTENWSDTCANDPVFPGTPVCNPMPCPVNATQEFFANNGF